MIKLLIDLFNSGREVEEGEVDSAREGDGDGDVQGGQRNPRKVWSRTPGGKNCHGEFGIRNMKTLKNILIKYFKLQSVK
jgi:hypothetical protein